MTTEPATVIGGVDTHKHTHYAAAVGHGEVQAIGVESTGSFGASLTRYLTAAGVSVVEVNRPNRLARRMDGKSDRLDAEQSSDRPPPPSRMRSRVPSR